MATREIHLELLLGKRVLDRDGRAVGRIEEVDVEQQGDEWIITHYLIGPAALLERLSVWTVGLRVLHVLGISKLARGYSGPWQQLDLADPERPRLCCAIDELEVLPVER
jgi:hypothetical protein